MPEGVFLATPWAWALCWNKALFCEGAKARSGEDGKECHLLRTLGLSSIHRLVHRLSSAVEEGDYRSGFRIEISQEV